MEWNDLKMWSGRHCREDEGRLRWYEHVIRRNEEELVRDIMEWRDQKMWSEDIVEKLKEDWGDMDM